MPKKTKHSSGEQGKLLDPSALALAVAAADFALPRKPIFGCQPRHIQRLENYFGVILPRVYREFLLAFGWDTGDILSHITVTYPQVARYHFEAVESFEDAGMRLPKDRFVFAYEDSDVAFFDIVPGVDDPLVSLLSGEELVNRNEPLSKWLNDLILNEIACGEQAKSSEGQRMAERQADRFHRDQWKAIAASKFQPGDVVRVREAVVDTRSGMDRRSVITLKKGTVAEVCRVHLRPDNVGCVCVLEVCNESGDKLVACPTVDNWYLELVSSKGRLRPKLKWQDLIH